MSFTVLFAGFALFALIVIFGLTFIRKGLKSALITTAAAFIVIAILFVVTIYAIVNAMPN
jgi:hypothetical protein